jgi:starvation-inducible DNA-binding protein
MEDQVTQTVLKNEITELAPESSMNSEQRKEVADAVANILSDAYRLLVNTQGLHWNVEGPLFYSIHKLTESQYQEISESIDVLAERIRALGLPAPQSFREFAERSILQDLPEDADLKTRIQRLVGDYERAVRRAGLTARLAESNGDVKTADLLTNRVGVYEENAWMLRATIAS